MCGLLCDGSPHGVVLEAAENEDARVINEKRAVLPPRLGALGALLHP